MKKSRSIVLQVVLLPMTVMLVLVFISIGVSLYAVSNLQSRMADSYEGTARVTLSRADSRLKQIDSSFVDYWIYNTNHSALKNLPADTRKEDYLKYQTGAVSWMSHTADLYPEVEGLVIHYSNLNFTQFQGKANFPMHSYVSSYLSNGESVYNRWQLVNISGKKYLFTMKRYGSFCGGVWIDADVFMEDQGWNSTFPGSAYFADADGESYVTAGQHVGAEVLSAQDSAAYYNRPIITDAGGLTMGVLISKDSMRESIPTYTRTVQLLAVLSIVLIPVITLWLRHRIAIPVSAIDQGMRRIGAGEMDYRIPPPNRRTEDEFDHLVFRFNEMMDELNELEYNLYISKIKQQQTELKYISQQIRPHFILNALNIIYTCDESEFPLVKKMVLYLAEYFRYIVNLKEDFVEAQQELRHTENYLNIQKERYSDRFDFVVEWESQAGKVLIPPLLLQTFVENCIKYGMRSEGKTLICVIAAIHEGRLKISVMDTGDGFSEDTLEKLSTFMETRRPQDGLGVGLQNAVERTDALYGERVDIRFYNLPTGGAAVEVYLPLKTPERAEEEAYA